MKFSGLVLALYSIVVVAQAKADIPKNAKGSANVGKASGADTSPTVPSKERVAEVLGDGGDANEHMGPTTWWGIPLERMPGLQDDITKLNSLLEDVAKDEYESSDPETYKKYSSLLSLGTSRATTTSPTQGQSDLSKMVKIASTLTDAQCLSVARIFTHSLNLVNVAENHHRFRLIKAEEEVRRKPPPPFSHTTYTPFVDLRPTARGLPRGHA